MVEKNTLCILKMKIIFLVNVIIYFDCVDCCECCKDCLEKNENMFVLDDKTPVKAKNDEDDNVVDNSVNVLINMINNCEGWGEKSGNNILGHGDWNDKIWAAAYYCKREDIETIKDGIIDPLKRQYFEEKLRYKKN